MGERKREGNVPNRFSAVLFATVNFSILLTQWEHEISSKVGGSSPGGVALLTQAGLMPGKAQGSDSGEATNPWVKRTSYNLLDVLLGAWPTPAPQRDTGQEGQGLPVSGWGWARRRG